MNIQPTGFDYSTLDAETRIVVQQREGEIKALFATAKETFTEIGRKLIDVKSRLEHGQFVAWLQSCFDWSHQTATSYMRMVELVDQKSDYLIFTPTVIGVLAKPSTPDTVGDELLKRQKAGEKITVKLANEVRLNHLPPSVMASKPLQYGKPEDDYQDELPVVNIDEPTVLPSISNGHLSPNAPVGTVYRNGKAEPSTPLIPMVNAPHLNPAANGKPYTNGTGTPPVDSTKLQAEIIRLRAENAQLKAQLETHTPKMIIHMVRAAWHIPDNQAIETPAEVNAAIKAHGEATTRAALGLLIQYKVKPFDFQGYVNQLVKTVKAADVDPAEEQRKADEKAAKKAEQERKAAEKEARRQPLPAAVMNPMKDAIYQGFGWERDKITKHMWGEIQEAAKQLCEVKCCPEHVKHGVRFLKNNFDGAGPLALAKHYPTWSKSIPKPIPETEPELELVGPPTEEARLAWENVENLFGRI